MKKEAWQLQKHGKQYGKRNFLPNVANQQKKHGKLEIQIAKKVYHIIFLLPHINQPMWGSFLPNQKEF